MVMSGIFYNPDEARLHRVVGAPMPGWRFVTHDLSAGINRCRRIMREWLPSAELLQVQWGEDAEPERRSA